MKSALRLAVVAVSIAALAGPALAQRPSKAERMPRPAAAKMAVATPSMRAPVRSGTDWDFLVGVDRASSPYGHDGF
jgi:hypothetical protein